MDRAKPQDAVEARGRHCPSCPRAGPLWGEGQREGLSPGERFGKEGQVASGHFLRSLPFSLSKDFWCHFHEERSCC